MIKMHSIKVEEELWVSFSRKCAVDGTNCSSKLREFMRRYVSEVLIENKDVLSLIDDTYDRSGRVPLDLISRNTTNQNEYEAAVDYCQMKEYKIISSPEKNTVCKDPTGW